MYKNHFPFGIQVYGETIGEIWIDIIEAVIKEGKNCFDEGRKRKALENVRFKSNTQIMPDELILKYGDEENLNSMLDLTFKEPKMFDCDITPSFSSGAKSYYQRIKEGKLIEYVIKRLSQIPESKKAVIVFPNYDDYQQVLNNMKDDYLPCLISIQFRLVKSDDKNHILNATCNFRSLDILQKGHGNLYSIAMMSKIIAEELSKNLKTNVYVGFLDAMITDVHIYENTIEEANKILNPINK